MPLFLIALWLDPPASDWLVVGAGLLAAMLVFLIGVRWSAHRRREMALREAVRMEEGILGLGSLVERRGAPRKKGNTVVVLVSDVSAEVKPVRGRVVDRSARGLALVLDEEGKVKRGTILSVRPAGAPKSVTWVQVQVRNRKQQGDSWRLGCRFVEPPGSDVLLLFG